MRSINQFGIMKSEFGISGRFASDYVSSTPVLLVTLTIHPLRSWRGPMLRISLKRAADCRLYCSLYMVGMLRFHYPKPHNIALSGFGEGARRAGVGEYNLERSDIHSEFIIPKSEFKSLCSGLLRAKRATRF